MLSILPSSISQLKKDSAYHLAKKQNFLSDLDRVFPKNNELGEVFWQKVCNPSGKSNQKFLDQGLIDNVIYLRSMFKQYLGVELGQVHFEAAYKMIGGSAIDFSSCPSSYLTVVIGACWLNLHGFKSHLVYLNDELSHYRGTAFQKLFDALQIDSAIIRPEMALAQRATAYHQSVTFCSMRELGLDTLRMKLQVNEGSDSSVNYCQGQGLLSFTTDNPRNLSELSVVLVEDIGMIMVDAMMTPLEVSMDQFSAPETSNNEIVSISSFNKIVKTFTRVGGVSAYLDHHTESDLARYDIPQYTLQPFRKIIDKTIHVYNKDINRDLALLKEINAVDVKVRAENKAQVCLIDNLTSESKQQFIESFSQSKCAENVKLISMGMDELLTFFVSNDRLPQQGTVCVLIEGALTVLPDISEQFDRIQDVLVNSYSMAEEHSFRMSKKRLSLLAGLFDCQVANSYITLGHFNNEQSTKPGDFLGKLPEWFNQLFLPNAVKILQKYHDKKRRKANKALLVYEREMDDLLAFSG